MSAAQIKQVAESESTAARKLHPEDILVGDDVAPSLVSYQYPSFMWCGADQSMLPPDEIIRLVFLPSDFELLSVKTICLPFVLCETVDGKHEVIDVRQIELVRLDKRFATAVRSKLKQDRKSANRKKKSKKSK